MSSKDARRKTGRFFLGDLKEGPSKRAKDEDILGSNDERYSGKRLRANPSHRILEPPGPMAHVPEEEDPMDPNNTILGNMIFAGRRVEIGDFGGGLIKVKSRMDENLWEVVRNLVHPNIVGFSDDKGHFEHSYCELYIMWPPLSIALPTVVRHKWTVDDAHQMCRDVGSP